MESFDRLVSIMETLRQKCPWDREQTHQSLKTYALEEVYEVLESIDNEDDQNLQEELGDLLIQIIFHSIIAREREKFSLENVVEKVSEKLVHRHPHVFSDTKVKDSTEVLHNWELLKKQENKKSQFANVPITLPALLKAYRIQNKAALVGFDWPDISGVWVKIEEEINELKEGIESQKKEHIQEELGDLLFSIVNLSRFLKVDPEDALRRTTDKFIRRFHFIEEELEKKGSSFKETTLEEMDKIWEKSKEK